MSLFSALLDKKQYFILMCMLIWKWDMDVFLYSSPLYCLRQSLSLDVELTNWLDCLHSPSIGITGVCHHNWLLYLFNVAAGDLDSGPHVCTASTFPTEESSWSNPRPSPPPHTTPIKSVSRLGMMVHTCNSGRLWAEATASSRLGLGIFRSFVSRNKTKRILAQC